MLILLSPIANHLWQSTVFVIVAAALALALRKNRAGIRHWIWCIASLKFIVPLSLFITLGSQFGWPVTSSVSAEPSVSAFVIQQMSQPFTTISTYIRFRPLPLEVPRVFRYLCRSQSHW
jgi:bla regulator protein BlaR1